MIQKPFDDITAADIRELIENKVCEVRTLEYKRELPGSTDDAKKEFLADVSSFANASGGDLIFGLSDTDGVPDGEVVGLGEVVVDKEKLRLENMLRDGIAPRIPGYRIASVELDKSGSVLIVRVPKSWVSPHMVTFRNTSRFYTRNSAGKYQLDVGEIRFAFAMSETLPEKIAEFRADRVGKVIAGETPVPVESGPKIILHVVPRASFGGGLQIAPSAMYERRTELLPLTGGGVSHRYNLDGLLTHLLPHKKGEKSWGYCQMFRQGIIEVVDCYALGGAFDEEPSIPSIAYEERVIEGVRRYTATLSTLNVPLPFVVLMSMVGADGLRMAVSQKVMQKNAMRMETHIDRNVLLLPDVLIEEYDCDMGRVLRPVFDAVWNAAGWERSLNYDKDGNWTAQAQRR